MRAVVTIAAIALACIATTAASADVRRVGAVAVYTSAHQGANVDFANAREMPIPAISRAPRSQAEALRLGPLTFKGKPGFSPGGRGTGETSPVQLTPPRPTAEKEAGGPTPQEFGTSSHVFSTARVGHMKIKIPLLYPKRAAGKLFFKIAGSTYVCSASLIKPGVVVTAAHCVAEFGTSQFYSDWTFVPAYNGGQGPYGTWTTIKALVMASYLNGTETCAVPGVVCPNDIAVLVQNVQDNIYPGTKTGYFGFGFDGYGFNGQNQALINQLGYPVALDLGELMQRNDSQSFADPTMSNNNIIGSLMTGGSSGGPWTLNLGIAPTLQGTDVGSEATHNVVVGVTSWGYLDTQIKEMGASSFTSGNIVSLVNTACTDFPAAC